MQHLEIVVLFFLIGRLHVIMVSLILIFIGLITPNINNKNWHMGVGCMAQQVQVLAAQPET